MDKLDEFIYSAVTAFFVFSALFQTLFFPIVGGISGFAVLILLTFKFIAGKVKEKNLSSEPSSFITSKAGGGVAKGNIYMMIIAYLVTPMNKFEKGMLLLGWALWPIFFPLMLTIIIIALKEQCTIAKVDWCTVFNSFNF